MFYSRKLSTYDLGMSVSDYGSAFMCMWHGGIGGPSANEVVSRFFKFDNFGEIT